MTKPVEVTVTSPGYWVERPQQLAALLGTGAAVIPDPSGAPPDPSRFVVLSNPLAWAADAVALGHALRAAVAAPADGLPAEGSGAVAPAADRLVYTVEEAASLLGISRAFAYEAVQRGEIPSMRIGRRILVPKAALQRMLDAAGKEGLGGPDATQPSAG